MSDHIDMSGLGGLHIDVELAPAEHVALLLLCGYACGAADNMGDRSLFASFLHITNRLNESNPNFKPYEIPR